MNPAWLKDRALLFVVSLVAAILAWFYFQALGNVGIALLMVAIIGPEVVAGFRLRRRMQRFATEPGALLEVSREFRQLVAAGEKKKAVALYRQAFGLSTGEALRAIAALEAT